MCNSSLTWNIISLHALSRAQPRDPRVSAGCVPPLSTEMESWTSGYVEECASSMSRGLLVQTSQEHCCAQAKVVMNKAYTPKFNKAFEHFLLHTGGRAVIDEMEEKLSLTPAQCQPSKDALYRFGNTSAASTW